jgi:hypothetical protein
MKVTALVGAGAVLPIQGPSTQFLTNLVRATQQLGNNPAGVRTNFVEQVAQALDGYFRQGSNFEDVLHALESLSSIERGWQPGTAKEFRPAVGAFVSPNDPRWFADPSLILSGKQSVLTVIAENVEAYAAAFSPTGRDNWFAGFWQEAARKGTWNFGTLNYDNCIEQSLAGALEDGFVPLRPGLSRFDPRRFIGSTVNRILHLHGSIFYGHEPGRDPLASEWEDLAKFDVHQDAKNTWFGRSRATAQSGEETIMGPLITGLRKADKIMIDPYSTYYWTFHQALLESPRLLVAGYSFRDQHLDYLLERMSVLHGRNRRIVIIDFFSNPTTWHPDPAVMDWPPRDSRMLEFICKATAERNPFGTMLFVSPIISPDGCARIYLRGFKDAVENHGTEILDFLTS